MKSKLQNLFAGMGSIISLGPINTALPKIEVFPETHQLKFDQVDGFQHDWEMVGKDLWHAFERYEKEKPNAKETQ